MKPVHRSEDHGSGLGDIFAPKTAAPTSYAAPEPLQKAAYHQPTPGVGLGEMLAPRGEAPRSFAAPAMVCQADHMARRQHRDNGWEGVSLGDALSKPPPQDPPHASTDGPSYYSASGASQGRRPPTDDVWSGVSLGDALAPKKGPVRRTFGQQPEESEVQGSKPYTPPGCGNSSHRRPSANDNGFAGGPLADAMQPQPQRDARLSLHGARFSNESQQVGLDVIEASQRKPADPWAGVSLGDALGKPSNDSSAPVQTRAAPAAYEPRRAQGGGIEKTPSASSCEKSPAEVIVWLKTLPDTHVPEKARDELAAIIERGSLDGNSFTSYVQTVPPDVCAPKHAMKLKAAWKNVLAEADARAVCRQNVDNAGSRGKAEAFSC